MADANQVARPPASGTPSAALKLACYACKRRKVKCDRQRPICSLCLKLNVACEYPSHPEKPGPKTGSLQSAKRRKLHHTPDSRRNTGHGLDPSSAAAGDTGFRRSARHNLALSPSRRRGVRLQDGSPIRGDISTPEPVVDIADSPSGQTPGNNGHPTSAPIFSRIMYPSHEIHTRPQSPAVVDTPPQLRDTEAVEITVQSVCDSLGISRAMYDVLMELYFTNMTSFTLFRPGSIEPKFATMQHHSDAEALVAAMFSFSARHCGDRNEWPSPSKFVHIASSKLDESVDRYGDTPPPFWLLQAGVLVTFYHLTLRVRSRSWKKLGDCIRYAYDTNLHLIDANHDATSTADKSTIDTERWALLEERRRTWWAIWEMDVFASTIRRLPTAIDASLNLTMLPVPDSCWFNSKYQESCFLVEDCNLRWKYLARSGNQSAKAWFIVVNSLMRNTQRIVYYPASSVVHPQRHGPETNYNEELNVIANCLYCTIASVPASLVYQGETLDFRPKHASSEDQGQDQDQDSTINPRQHHADKYALHLMTQLCRFMIYHQKICTRAPWLAQQQQQHRQQQEQQQQRKDTSSNTEPTAPQPPPPPSKTPPHQSNSEWSNYMDASAEIVALVRHCARDHHRYVNPFLVNTLWFAAAAQCACKVFGPATFSKRLAASNLDLLKLVIDRFVAFWGGMENLQGRLERIESSLQGLMVGGAGGGGNGGDRSASSLGRQQHQQQHRHQHERQPVTAAQGSNSMDGPTRRSATAQPGMPADDSLGAASPPQNNAAVPGGAELLQLDAPGGGLNAPGGWPDPSRRSAFGGSGLDLYDFTQLFQVSGMAGQNFQLTAAAADPMDVSPFGLEELLMASYVDSQLYGMSLSL